MKESIEKYELLAAFPLTGTDEELKVMGAKLEEKIKQAGGTVHTSMGIQKGPFAYVIGTTRQGYFHTIQFEINPRSIEQFRKELVLSGSVLRFAITRVEAFKAFVPSAPRPMKGRVGSGAVAGRPMMRPGAPAGMPGISPVAGSSAPIVAPAQEIIKPENAPKVTMEELDRRLEEILGEK